MCPVWLTNMHMGSFLSLLIYWSWDWYSYQNPLNEFWKRQAFNKPHKMLYWVHLAMSRSLTHKLLGVKSLVEQILNIIIYIQCILKQKNEIDIIQWQPFCFYMKKGILTINSINLDTKMNLNNRKDPLFILTLRSDINWNCCLISENLNSIF